MFLFGPSSRLVTPQQFSFHRGEIGLRTRRDLRICHITHTYTHKSPTNTGDNIALIATYPIHPHCPHLQLVDCGMSLSQSQFPTRILLFVLLCIIAFTLLLGPIQYVAGSVSETNIQLNRDASAIEANFPKNTQSSEAAIQAKKYAERAITTLYGVSFSISSQYQRR